MVQAGYQILGYLAGRPDCKPWADSTFKGLHSNTESQPKVATGQVIWGRAGRVEETGRLLGLFGLRKHFMRVTEAHILT